ncbi:GDSL-type esterase/lipase family protein [Granulicella arctica]|uniref:GDSL-type esterase/lipase family protein n=1 Tax=Granulicella arctica TaxID=940613 RepID=UPI0021DFB286|nr:GDSL-type esterase/lipase family protein [Granulicella arctica]
MRFPLKTALTFTTFILALVAWRHWKDHDKGIAPAIFAEAWQLRLHRSPAAPVVPLPQQEQPLEATETTHTNQTVPRPALSTYLFDDSGALDSFFGALGQLNAPASDKARHVAILHYGDSPTTADLITGDVRALLQQRFGDAGHGYLLIAKPWAWYGHRDTDITGHGWTISTAVGKMRADTYGTGGASFQGAAGGASSHITLKDAAQSSMELSYLAQPEGGSVLVTADDAAGAGQPVATISTASETREPAWKSVELPEGTKAVDIKAGTGHVELFGETFEKAQRGVLYDSLGLNGASTTVLSRGFNPEIWAAELRHDAPALVIINYGTNESSFGSFVDKQYEGELRTAIGRIRNALPNVSILVMSPMDRGERSGIDEIVTMGTIPRIVAIQKRVAADTRCAFFDTFNAMGGDGTMSRWYTGKPRLVAADLIHPTPQGASIIAQIFVKNLMVGFDAYKPHPATAPVTDDGTRQAVQP